MDYIVKAYKDWKLHSQFQEIVPDMDDEFMFNEKQSIRESARSLKKYGSTCCNHIRNNETLIRHNVEKTDTLQGIALKYGCTTEQIRRANRLFASDSLFLRLFLLIPVEKNSPYYPTQNGDGNLNGDTVPSHNQTPISDYNIADMVHTAIPTPLTTSVTATDLKAIANLANSSNSPRSSNNLPQRPYSIAGELLIQTSDDDPAVLNSHHNSNCSSSSSNGSSSGCGSGGSSSSSSQSSGGGASTSKSLDSVVAMSPEEESRKCINDFLNKIDTTISESKKYVEKSREMLTTRSDDDLFVMNTEIVERRRNNLLNSSYKNNNGSSNPNSNNNNDSRHQRHSSNGSGNSDTAQLLNTTQLRRVQNSLKRLEKQQDDFFEL